MLLRVLERLRDHPAEPKFRSISATSERLQKDVLGVEGGAMWVWVWVWEWVGVWGVG